MRETVIIRSGRKCLAGKRGKLGDGAELIPVCAHRIDKRQRGGDGMLRKVVHQDDIRALADILDSILKTGAFCVIGNEQQIEADHNMFKEVKELFH